MAKLKKILLPIDGSEASDVAIDRGIDESKKLGAKMTEIIFLYVVSLPTLPDVGPSIKSTVGKEMLKRAEKYINKAEGKAKKEFARYRSSIKKGDPAETIVKTSKKEDVDLIVMAKHRKGELDRFLLGSVTEKVLRGVKCDVLVVQPTAVKKG